MPVRQSDRDFWHKFSAIAISRKTNSFHDNWESRAAAADMGFEQLFEFISGVVCREGALGNGVVVDQFIQRASAEKYEEIVGFVVFPIRGPLHLPAREVVFKDQAILIGGEIFNGGSRVHPPGRS